MIKLFYKLFILSISAMFLFSCSDGNHPASSSSSSSFIEGYNPQFTEAKGTSHTGNFFPIDPGLTWEYSGPISTKSELDMKASGGGMKLDTVIHDSISELVQSQKKFGLASKITLPSGSYTLYPEITYTTLLSTASDKIDTARYFEKTDEAVFIRAIYNEEFGLAEVTNPVYIRNPLVVGDSWESTPSLNINKLNMDGMEMDLSITAKCKMFVIGKESLALSTGTVSAIRVDEVVEFTGSATILGMGTMTIKGNGIVEQYFVENTGFVASNEQIEMNMKGSFQEDDASVTIDGDVSISGDFKMTNFSLKRNAYYTTQYYGEAASTVAESKSENRRNDGYLNKTKNFGVLFVNLLKKMY